MKSLKLVECQGLKDGAKRRIFAIYTFLYVHDKKGVESNSQKKKEGYEIKQFQMKVFRDVTT
jgi:hypothetical protein